MKSIRSIALLGAAAAASIAVGVAPSAHAAAAAVCTVTGAVNSSGIGVTPSNNTFGFTSVAISCTSSDPTLSGSYHVNASGNTTDETCAGGPFSGSITGGTAPDGSTLSGSFTGARAGANVAVHGSINFGSHNTTFNAHLIFQPTNGICSGGSGNTTAANIITGSSAEVDDQGA